ncbi:unnamed protein product [Caenorhabditis angaria]|uniref:Uncharacterized protein n=1 Tax=Caenorhabditis angaria TaxID=860376 RepID=A0A9P1IN19_9PELO|nr:unnamed protein product [Caenorhabditis angaria]
MSANILDKLQEVFDGKGSLWEVELIGMNRLLMIVWYEHDQYREGLNYEIRDFRVHIVYSPTTICSESKWSRWN